VSVTVYSIGHSNRDTDHLVALLRQHGIQLLADIRSQPASRYLPHFGRTALQRSLPEAGIAYRWLGEALGGKPRAPLPVFSAGIETLLELAAQQPVAMMCAERDPAHCHRAHLVTPALLARGAAVQHIHGDGHLESDADLRRRIAPAPPRQPDLFG
jgi:uncharacterized protein (DUF488 family)